MKCREIRAVMKYGDAFSPSPKIAAGMAEYRPIARNTTKAGRSRNRRIEVRLLPAPTVEPQRLAQGAAR